MHDGYDVRQSLVSNHAKNPWQRLNDLTSCLKFGDNERDFIVMSCTAGKAAAKIITSRDPSS